MSLRGMFLGILLATFAVSAGAADKRFKMEGGDTLSIKGGDDWIVGDQIPESPFGTLTLHGADKTKWRLTIVPLPPHPTLTGDTGNLRIYVRNMARAADDDGAQVNDEQKAIEGASARGFYFKARDARKKTKQQIKAAGGEYTDAYVGALSINSRAYLFEVIWNEGSEPAANAALSAIKTIRIQ